MRIEKLDIKGFGKLNNLSLNFFKGLNIVYGKNESGKTSIQWFIKGMLFGLKGGKASKDGIPPPVKKFKPWLANDFTGFMEYKLDGGELYRIGRNFSNNSTRIFDSLFNDITASFEISKEKGVAFSEKHLGLNEACFDRTVFIRQMGSIIDEDGSKELLNRLVNVSQTGFEDVSFKKAQEALREALKSHVGTDKTTTRPLDKIVNRLDELKTIKNSLVSKRDSMFSLEEELNSALHLKKSLENKKVILTRLDEYVDLKINIRKNTKLKKDIKEIHDNIIKDEEELQTTLNRISDFNKLNEEYGKFSVYDNEDIDELERDYQKFLNLKEEIDKLKLETYRKQENLGKLKNLVGSMSIFSNAEDVENNVRKINNELEYLNKEYIKTNIEYFNENIAAIQKKEKLYKVSAILTALASIIGVAVAFVMPIIGIPLSLTAAAFTAALIILKKSESKKLFEIRSDKNLLTINATAISEEIRKNEKALKDIYRLVGVDNIEALLTKKTDYNNKVQQVCDLVNDINRIEKVVELNKDRAAESRKIISDKLLEVGIKLGDSLEINDKSIREFKYGVRVYKGNEPSLAYTEQRIEDLTKGLQKYLKNASSISGKDCGMKEDLLGIIENLELEYTLLAEKINICRQGTSELIIKEEFLKLYFSNLSEEYIEENLDEINSILDSENNKINEELNKVFLDIKEYETELKHQSSDDEQMHRIDEEIEILGFKKNHLEDTNISLKTALDVLTEASMEIQRDFAPALNIKMSEIINKISGGKYIDLRADDKLTLKTVSPETGEVVNASLLSGGTTDQMYLALRIAMSEIFTSKKESLPLIMDEVFSQYDDERTCETFKLLKKIVPEKQIIFFTCKSREIELAREIFGAEANVIEL